MIICASHVQLNPIFDFDNVKDDNVAASYNWGYDPLSYFALEGSYATDAVNPSSRMKEFSFMVEQLHKNNLRLIVDVVYNHVFEYATSYYEKIVPNYYFRRRKTGQIARASGCGNDVASERKMVRKLIIDSAKYIIKYYNIDGFRFDLMGLIDIDTINQLVKECKAIKNDLMFYGEGWNMGYELPLEKKACSDNCNAIPNMAFFNVCIFIFCKISNISFVNNCVYKVLDLCAAPGGKTVQASMALNKTGLLISNDLSHQRAGLILQNVERLGLGNIVITNNDFSLIYKDYQEHFDKIILDAPCSGSGMFRKQREMEDDWSYQKVLKFAEIQKELIRIAYFMLKPGGKLIYSTCSFSKEEDEDVVEELLNNSDALCLINIT